MCVIWFVTMATATHVPARGLASIVRPLPSRIGGLPVDKLMHFGAYTGFAFLAAATASLGAGRIQPVAMPLSIGPAIVVVGLIDEWSQPFVSRQFELRDWAADVAGVSAGIALFLAVAACARFPRSESS